jgi:hypothetical protein
MKILLSLFVFFVVAMISCDDFNEFNDPKPHITHFVSGLDTITVTGNYDVDLSKAVGGSTGTVISDNEMVITFGRVKPKDTTIYNQKKIKNVKRK